MPGVALGVGAYKRTAARLSEVKLRNRYLEPDPTNAVDQVALMPRPALVLFLTLGTGPIRCIFRQSGVLNGDYLVVSGTTLYRLTAAGVSTAVGTIAGGDKVEIASDGASTFIAAGMLYLYDGAALTTVATPGGVSIVSVVQFNSYFLLQVEDSGRFYWIQPGAIIIDPLDFATAERAPDAGVAIRIVGDFIAFLNAQWTEFWTATGDSDSPFQRQAGLLYEKGCIDRDTAVNLDNGLFWVSETASEGRVVYRGGQGAPERISVFGVEEAMRLATGLSAFAFTFDGHPFYVLRCEGVMTFVYDVSTETWCEFASYMRDNWRVQCAGQAPGASLLLGDDEDGSLWTLDPEIGHDGTDTPIQRLVTGHIPIVGKRDTIKNIVLEASVGWSPSLTLEPQIEMRIARDGFTFGNPRARSLGERGNFAQPIHWERCGEIRPPGLVLEFADSDDCQTRISYCRFNETF